MYKSSIYLQAKSNEESGRVISIITEYCQESYHVLNPEDALSTLKRLDKNVDLFVTDICEPNMEELELIDQIAALHIGIIGIMPNGKNSSLDITLSSMMLHTRHILKEDFTEDDMRQTLIKIFPDSIQPSA